MEQESLRVTTLTLGQLDTNCYLVWGESSRECIIIDPADSAETITQHILDLELTPLSILLTHAHFDHVLACLELKLNFDIPIFLHPADTPLLAQAQTSAQYWLKHPVDPIPQQTFPLGAETRIQLAGQSLQIIETPGHTPGSICIFTDTPHPILFTGDTLFKASVGRTDFAYSSPAQLETSLQTLFKTLPPETLCYPGHGEPTILNKEKP